MDRRGFLRGTAGATGIGALSLLPDSLIRAWAEPAPSGGLSNVEHVVILMQENRSFDHYYGTVAGVRGYGDLAALQLPGGRSVFHQPDGDGYVLPFATDLQNHEGCDHSSGGGHAAWADGRYDRWVAAKGARSMVHYDRGSLEFYHQLAEAFTIGDNYHCSLNGATDPNRLYLFTGAARNPLAMDNFASVLQETIFTSRELSSWMRSQPADAVAAGLAALLNGSTSLLPQSVVRAVEQAIGQPETNFLFALPAVQSTAAQRIVAEAVYGLPWTTYAERLQDRGVSWKVYQEWDNYGDNSLEYFATFRRVARESLKYTDFGDGVPFETFKAMYNQLRADPGAQRKHESALQRGLSELAPADRQLVERALLRAPTGTLAEKLRADVQSGALPKVSWIVLPFDQCEHPAMGPRNGQAVVRDVLDALCGNRDVWNKTVFILNYDENDGYFDHVPGPVPPPGTADEYLYGHNIGLGSRVPLLVVSPWSKQAVCSELFDHTSVLRFLEQVTGVEEPNISAWRRKMCGDLTATLDFGSSVAPVVPAAQPPAAQPDEGAPQPVPEMQRLPAQAAGSRTRIPLPYRPTARAEQRSGGIAITLGNDGTAATHFTVHPNAFAADYTPSRFDIDPGAAVTADFTATDGRYDYTVYGIDGFQRRFAGDLTAPGGALEVTATVTLRGARRISLEFTNSGATPVAFLVRSNAYRGDGPWRIEVPAAGSGSREWVLDTEDQGRGWYDLTVTADVDAGFLRRLRGYVDHGTRGVTADDAAPFDRLLLDRSIYESGRDLVVTYCVAGAVSAHRLAVYADPGVSLDVPRAEPVRALDLPNGNTRDQVTMPMTLSSPLPGSSTRPSSRGTSGSGGLAAAEPLPAGAYVVHHLDGTNKPLAQPVRFRVV
ncbi:alkaline phosphatase family protein [Nocardia mexicana]|uniref:phospholipase C n=1 Tax=Nocardia mexicana TaxID=279262 RepID=A0A370H219_9NOCA|nr:alkaline phosphatase family protein [Nocardia mexicana]RDI50056.1 uncharacterized protein DUF756 [Nocardia mexicana]